VKAKVRAYFDLETVGKVDEAHLLDPAQLEELRLLTLCRDRDYAGDLHELADFATGSRSRVPHNSRRFP